MACFDGSKDGNDDGDMVVGSREVVGINEGSTNRVLEGT